MVGGVGLDYVTFECRVKFVLMENFDIIFIDFYSLFEKNRKGEDKSFVIIYIIFVRLLVVLMERFFFLKVYFFEM